MVLEFGGAEIEQDAYFYFSGFEVVDELCILLAGKIAQRFQFHEDVAVTEEVGDIESGEFNILIIDMNGLFAHKGDVAFLEFDFEGLLINGFQKTGAKDGMDFHSSTDEVVSFVFVDELHCIFKDEGLQSACFRLNGFPYVLSFWFIGFLVVPLIGIARGYLMP